MTEILLGNSKDELSSKLDDDLARVRDSLRTIEEGIKNLTGRGGGGGGGGGPPSNLGAPGPPINEFGRFSRPGQRQNSQNFVTSGGQMGQNDGGFPNFPGYKRRLGGPQSPQEDFNFPPYKRQVTAQFLGGQNEFLDDEKLDFKAPSLASSVQVTLKEAKSREEAIQELKENEKLDSKNRNRRMFGLLLGTLQKFKKTEVENRQFKEQEKRRQEIEQKLDEKKRREQQELKREKEKLLEKRRKQQSELRRLQRKKALLAASQNQIDQLLRLQNFIQTQTKPQIFFLPAKHTIRTIELQKKSQKRLEEVIKVKKEETEQELKYIDELKIDLDDDEIGLGDHQEIVGRVERSGSDVPDNSVLSSSVVVLANKSDKESLGAGGMKQEPKIELMDAGVNVEGSSSTNEKRRPTDVTAVGGAAVAAIDWENEILADLNDYDHVVNNPLATKTVESDAEDERAENFPARAESERQKSSASDDATSGPPNFLEEKIKIDLK